MLKEVEAAPFFSHLKEFDALLIEGLWDCPKAIILHHLAKTKRPIVVITGGERETKLFDDLQYFKVKAEELQSWEALPEEGIAPSPDIIGARLDVLRRLDEISVLLCPLQSALQKVPAHVQNITWKVGQDVSFDDVAHQLVSFGYQRVKLVSDKGQFAVRGGIIDLFPISAKTPYRVEFFGDTIEQIRTFDPMGQTSVEKVGECAFTPAIEDGELTSLLSLLDNPIVVFDDLLAIEDRYIALKELAGFDSEKMLRFDDLFGHTSLYFSKNSAEELSTETKVFGDLVTFEIFERIIEAKRVRSPFLPVKVQLAVESNTQEMQQEDLIRAIKNLHGPQLHLIAPGKKEEDRLKAWCSVRPENTTFSRGYLSSGFALGDKMLVIPYSEFTNRFKVTRKAYRTTYHTPASEFHELTPGDLVVHFHNGIGKFLGIEKQLNHLGIQGEFLVIEYAKNAKLYCPISQAHLVSKYIGSHEERPILHQIGSNRWAKAKSAVQTSIVGYAKDLLNAQAARNTKGGFVYNEDSEELTEFEEEFPYTETEDQLAAIKDIKGDMLSEMSMDRLVCGDVGYGKTEVAMRAASKAVLDGGKQVAVLVPTTVLAAQHFENFTLRMENFPINVGIVSRFQKPKQVRETLDKVRRGEIDILVGTHRLISKDVAFKDLGLLIIDEEQRFGVRTKEKLKHLKVGVDCITMTATPIPRTLYLSLVHAREMSVINSPPHDRLPIKTIICDRDLNVIKNALLRELARDGQSYFIHNRVDSIYHVQEELQKMVPTARIGVVHGQMDPDIIDRTFHAFKQGDLDILVATSIIENGIDIPNANTILVDRAHHFGIADLYQIRGRVGRWNKAAYAYFLTPKNKVLPELAQKRLQALVEASGFGGGMKLAMRDLELRGAGDILGVKQSGHVSSIGFHLYCKLLKRTIDAMKKEKPTTFLETKLEFTFDARLPDAYIDDSSLRLEIYHRLGEAADTDEADAILHELTDRFGQPPKPVLWLYHMSRIRIWATQNNFLSIKFEKMSITAEKQLKKNTLKKSILLPPLQGPREVELMTIKRLEDAF